MPYRPNFPIPDDIYAEPFCLCIQVPNDPVWKQVVAGLLDELNQWYNWQRDEAKSGKDCAQVWRNLYEQIDWTTMSCCCDNPPDIFKYVDGVLYRSTDGGITFSPAEDYDIRENPTVIFPEPTPEEGVDEKCLAADGMVALIREGIGDNLTEDMSRYTLGELITTWVTTMVGTSNPFTALVTIIVNQIFALVVGAVMAALTEEVYDTLRCIFSSHINDDISFDTEEWEGVRSDILGELAGVSGIFLEHIVYLLGAGGLTNLARSMAGTDDAGCCGSCQDDFDIWSDGGETFGEIVERGGDYIICNLLFCPTEVGEYFLRMKTSSIEACCRVTHYDIISGGTVNISVYTLCGDTFGTNGHTLNTDFGSGSDEVNTITIGSTGACQVKFYFE